MGLAERPANLAQRQAVAAVGQIHLMRYYQDFFAALGLVSCNGPFSWPQHAPSLRSLPDWLLLMLADMCPGLADIEQFERQRTIPECS